MLVDDDSDDAEIFEMAVKHTADYITFEYSGGGSEALNRLTSTAFSLPDLILVDAGMPKMNGWELLKNIKADDRIAKVPVIMIATSSRMEGISLAQNLGAEAYFIKPSNYDDLKSIMKNLCSGLRTDLKAKLLSMQSDSPRYIFVF